jgi:hypothetical protein
MYTFPTSIRLSAFCGPEYSNDENYCLALSAATCLAPVHVSTATLSGSTDRSADALLRTDCEECLLPSWTPARI